MLLRDLRVLAEKATKGPWKVSGCNQGFQGNAPGGYITGQEQTGLYSKNDKGEFVPQMRTCVIATFPKGNLADAEYIAAVDPLIVIGLLDEIARLNQEIDNLYEDAAGEDI